ncbi:glycosyltransferase [Patescibacteria group bacterium]|nr:glycosyltransferase [Patescibacteria group bacterium]MCG2701650.1 glycosyltransferase [Candidatus Parcubacteria bacterium]MBU4264998.1 glycosyltransferase [Patescibacteria group bacterium]MBU4390151.1 glycosyltransferase [Patescibacteria group bacterium]MBU4397084.1 glycosyltransferase [Patescibacteria group bacterium]
MKYDLIVIASYPPQNQIHGKGTVGVASYTKNTLLSISKTAKKTPKILVLAEKLLNQKIKYQEKNITIIRCWQRNSFFAYFQILKQINTHQASNILIEFEMAMFGNPILNSLLPLLLLFLKIKNKKTTIVLHQIVLDFNKISGHIGQKQNSSLNYLLSFLSKIFYKLIISFSSQIIVFERFLKDKLATIANPKKIIIIPHGVEPKNIKTNTKTVSQQLNISSKDFVITTFGFLAWYKGTDWLAKTMSNYLDKFPNSNLKLVIAGGPNPNHLDKPFYQNFIKNLKKLTQKHPKNIIITNFVDEKDIASYYSLSHLIVLPYRTGMSSSGPLSLAFTHRKAFLLSKPISPILGTKDIDSSLKKLNLNNKDITFNLSSQDFITKVKQLKKNPSKLDLLSKLSQLVYRQRLWTNIAKQYIQILNI